MRWTPSREDAVPTGAAERRETAPAAPPAQQRPGTLVLLARAAAHDRISAALREARERAGLSPLEVVDLLRARGVSISAQTLERWERTGGIRLEDAVDLAAVYRISLDDLASRRSWNGRFLGSVERTRSAAA
jgi:8-oxo-dGTP pyrophosphatase MutT (NUDIX family)